MNVKKYSIRQALLYIVCQTIIDNLRANLEAFTEFSAHYTEEYVDELQAQLDAAKELPSEEARALMHEDIRLQMVDMLKGTLKKWKYLKRYIAKMYPNNEEQQQANWNAAGWQNYDAAAAKNWPSVLALLNAGSAYIHEHSTALLANQNMPAGFEAAYNLVKTAFAQKQTAYTNGLLAAREGTHEKIAANNTIYDLIIAVCLDGQDIFEGEFTEKLFSFNYITELVQPNGAAAADVTVTNAETGTPMSGVVITIEGTDKETTTNEAGEGELNQVAAGPAQLKLVCDGFEDKVIEHTFTAGVRSHIEATMLPLAVVVPEEVQPEPVNG